MEQAHASGVCRGELLMPPTICVDGEFVPARRAESTLSKVRGHMFRRRAPEWALVFPGERVRERSLHMLFVPFALEALFVVDGVVEEAAELKPWTGYAAAEADTVIEVPRGMVDAEPGSEVEVEVGD